MQKAISKSGKPYSPVEEYFYSIFLLALALLLVSRFLMVIFHEVMPLPLDGYAVYYVNLLHQITTVLVGACFLAYTIIRKMWLILIAISVHFALIVMTSVAFDIAVRITYDFSSVDFFNKLLFWAQIGLAAVFIIADKNQYSWFLFIGLSLASATILQLLIDPQSAGWLKLVLGILVFAQDAFLLLHLWYYRQKKMPFWFFMK